MVEGLTLWCGELEAFLAAAVHVYSKGILNIVKKVSW